MIPRINCGRLQLPNSLNRLGGGCYTLCVYADVYSDLFNAQHPEISRLASNGWETIQQMNYLRFAGLSYEAIAVIEGWRERFSKYVLLGLNANLQDDFTNELDFCMALDFTKVHPASKRRTKFGEAEYQAKYHRSVEHILLLEEALGVAIKDLPIPSGYRESYCLTCIPARKQDWTLGRRLAASMAKPEHLNRDFVGANLTDDKQELKNTSVDDKIPLWRDLFDRNCVTLSGSVAGQGQRAL